MNMEYSDGMADKYMVQNIKYILCWYFRIIIAKTNNTTSKEDCIVQIHTKEKFKTKLQEK